MDFHHLKFIDDFFNFGVMSTQSSDVYEQTARRSCHKPYTFDAPQTLHISCVCHVPFLTRCIALVLHSHILLHSQHHFRDLPFPVPLASLLYVFPIPVLRLPLHSSFLKMPFPSHLPLLSLNWPLPHQHHFPCSSSLCPPSSLHSPCPSHVPSPPPHHHRPLTF